MGVEVKKRDNENTDSLVRRFSRVVQKSGVLLQARKVRYYQRQESKRKTREKAQRRTVLTAERDRLIKLGEIDEYDYPARGNKRWGKR